MVSNISRWCHALHHPVLISMIINTMADYMILIHIRNSIMNDFVLQLFRIMILLYFSESWYCFIYSTSLQFQYRSCKSHSKDKATMVWCMDMFVVIMYSTARQLPVYLANYDSQQRSMIALYWLRDRRDTCNATQFNRSTLLVYQ